MTEQKEKKTNVFMGLSELADLWEVHASTLRRYINKIAEKIPDYEKNQRLFSPKQYKVIAEHFGFDL